MKLGTGEFYQPLQSCMHMQSVHSLPRDIQQICCSTHEAVGTLLRTECCIHYSTNLHHMRKHNRVTIEAVVDGSTAAVLLYLWVCQLMHTQKSCSVGCDKTLLSLHRLYFTVSRSPQRAGRCLCMYTRGWIDGRVYICIQYVCKSAFPCRFDELILFECTSNSITIGRTC